MWPGARSRVRAAEEHARGHLKEWTTKQSQQRVVPLRAEDLVYEKTGDREKIHEWLAGGTGAAVVVDIPSLDVTAPRRELTPSREKRLAGALVAVLKGTPTQTQVRLVGDLRPAVFKALHEHAEVMDVRVTELVFRNIPAQGWHKNWPASVRRLTLQAGMLCQFARDWDARLNEIMSQLRKALGRVKHLEFLEIVYLGFTEVTVGLLVNAVRVGLSEQKEKPTLVLRRPLEMSTAHAEELDEHFGKAGWLVEEPRRVEVLDNDGHVVSIPQPWDPHRNHTEDWSRDAPFVPYHDYPESLEKQGVENDVAERCNLGTLE